MCRFHDRSTGGGNESLHHLSIDGAMYVIDRVMTYKPARENYGPPHCVAASALDVIWHAGRHYKAAQLFDDLRQGL